MKSLQRDFYKRLWVAQLSVKDEMSQIFFKYDSWLRPRFGSKAYMQIKRYVYMIFQAS